MPRIKEGFKGERAIVLPAFLIEELKQDPLGSELCITDIGYYPHAYFHYRIRDTEEVTEFILIYCMEGEGWFELDKHQYAVTANQFFILPEHQAHAYGSNEENPWTIYWIHFNGTKAAFFSAGFDRPKSITPQEDSRIGNREVYFRSDICQTNGLAQIFLHEMNRYLHYIFVSVTIAHRATIPIFANKFHGT